MCWTQVTLNYEKIKLVVLAVLELQYACLKASVRKFC